MTPQSKTVLPYFFNSWTNDRRTVTKGLDYQPDIGSSSNITPPEDLIAPNQTETTSGPVDKANNISIFDIVEDRKYHVALDSIGYPKDSFDVEYVTKDFLNQ